MKQTSTSKTPVTFDNDAPQLTQAAFDGARLRVGGKDASRAEWQAAVRASLRHRKAIGRGNPRIFGAMDCRAALAMTENPRHREAAGRGDPCILGPMDCRAALAMTESSRSQ